MTSVFGQCYLLLCLRRESYPHSAVIVSHTELMVCFFLLNSLFGSTCFLKVLADFRSLTLLFSTGLVSRMYGGRVDKMDMSHTVMKCWTNLSWNYSNWMLRCVCCPWIRLCGVCRDRNHFSHWCLFHYYSLMAGGIIIGWTVGGRNYCVGWNYDHFFQ